MLIRGLERKNCYPWSTRSGCPFSLLASVTFWLAEKVFGHGSFPVRTMLLTYSRQQLWAFKGGLLPNHSMFFVGLHRYGQLEHVVNKCFPPWCVELSSILNKEPRKKAGAFRCVIDL